jgi:hypothetical protein
MRHAKLTAILVVHPRQAAHAGVVAPCARRLEG